MEKDDRQYRTLHGQMTAESKIVGYCRLHKIHLTAPQVKEKECLRKDCHALKKWDCAFWERRERNKQIKQMKKERGIPVWEKVEIRTDHNGELLPPKEKR